MKNVSAGMGVRIGLLSMIFATGCASQGEVVNLTIPSAPAANASAAKAEGPSVSVLRFEDKRANKAWLGTHTGRMGGEERFNIRGNDAGQAVANALTDYLKSKGWRATAVSDASKANSDVTLSGEILEMDVDAKAGWFLTELTSKSKVLVQGLNRADGSKVRMTLTGTGADKVFWFNENDAQTLINDVLAESFSKFPSSTKFADGGLKLN
ncbi:MAG: hypothetical protein U0172_05805 [Nitrospiraceae bacterium]